MKLLVATSVVAILISAICCQDLAGNKYEDINVDEVLKNDRLLENYSNCILGKGPCTPEGEELKVRIKEALETGCEKCTDKQREGVRKVVKFLSEEKKDLWEEIAKVYDPDRTYREKYAELWKKEGLTL